MKEKRYTEDDLTVIWKPEVCIHSENCWRNLNSVFDPQRRPWIDPSSADKSSIMKTIDGCPSGALSYELANQSNTAKMESKKITIIPNGPVMIKGDCEITLPNGETVVKENRVTLCRCGLSTNKPFCDGSHKESFKVD